MGLTSWIPFLKSKEEKLEDREFKWILLEFYKFKLIDNTLKVAKRIRDYEKNLEKAKRLVEKAFRLLQGEASVERRLASGFGRMEKAVGAKLETIRTKHSHKFRDVIGKIRELEADLKKADVFNANLEKEASRGGDVEKSIKASEESLSKLDETIKEVEKVMTELKGFEVEIEKIKAETAEINKEIDGDMDDEERKEKQGEIRNKLKVPIDSLNQKIRTLTRILSKIKIEQEAEWRSARSEIDELHSKGLSDEEEDKWDTLSRESDNADIAARTADDYYDQFYSFQSGWATVVKWGISFSEKILASTEEKLKDFRETVRELEKSIILTPHNGDIVPLCKEILGFLDEIEKLIAEGRKI